MGIPVESTTMRIMYSRVAPKRQREPSPETGTAILELAIVLPVLVLLALGAIEFSRALQHMQVAVAASRELASLVYRDCAADPAGDPQASAPNQAEILHKINQHIDDVKANFTENLYPGTELRVALFRRNPTTNTYQEYTSFSHTSTTNCTSTVCFHGSTFTHPVSVHDPHTNTIGQGVRITRGGVDTDISQRDIITVAEAFVPYQAIFSQFLGLFDFDPTGFYDATIL